MRVVSISISKVKGVRKKNVSKCKVIKNYGIVGDAHSKKGGRKQVSLLRKESLDKMEREINTPLKPGDLAENLCIEGMKVETLKVGKKIKVGKEVILEITSIGKKCNKKCEIYYKVGKCIMHKEGIFMKVLKGGEIKVGEKIEVI
jgi:MOSC domain-containing protein YiiM